MKKTTKFTLNPGTVKQLLNEISKITDKHADDAILSLWAETDRRDHGILGTSVDHTIVIEVGEWE